MVAEDGKSPPWQVYVLPSIHQDISFLKSAAEDMQLYVDEYRKYLQLMEKDPAWCYSSEFAWTVRYFLQRHPEQRERLTRFVREGRFGITAQCSGFDPSFYSGEFIIREIAVAKEWLRRTFGYEPRTVDLADVPDFTPQLPQILRGCEVGFFLYTRAGGGRNRDGAEQHIGEYPGMWELLDNELMQLAVLNLGQDRQTGELRALYPGYWDWKREHMRDQPISRLWNYVGLNGESVLAYAACSRYSGLYGLQLPEGVRPRHWFENEEVFLSNLKPGIDPAHAALGVIGTDEEEIDATRVSEKVAAWNRMQAVERGIRLQLSTVEQFATHMVEAVKAGEATPGDYSGMAPGWSYSLFDADDFHIIQNRLPAAEMLAAFNALLGQAPYPARQFDRAWNILWMVSHNQRSDDEYYRAVRDSARVTVQVLQRALSQFTAAVKPARTSPPLLIFSPLNWERSECVRVDIAAGGPTTVVDSQGRALPSAVVAQDAAGRVTLEFIAHQVPGLGYRTFYLEECQAPTTDLEAGESWIQNRYFRVELDAEGYLHLLDREQGQELTSTRAVTGPLRLVAQGQRGELPWSAEGCTAHQDGVKATLTLAGKLGRSPAALTFSLPAGLKRLDLDVDLDWDGQRGVRVYLPLPFHLAPEELRLGVACGHVPYVRPTAMMNLRGARLSRRAAAASFSTFWVLPQDCDPLPGDGFGWAYLQKWAYLGPQSGGVVVASGRRSGLVVGEGWLAIPLMSVPAHRARHVRRARIYERGAHRWSFSCTTVGCVEEAPRFGWQVAQPLLATSDWREGGSLADAGSLIYLEPEQAICMAFKRSFDEQAWVLRFFESQDQDTQAQVRLHPALNLDANGASQVNMLERQGQPVEATSDGLRCALDSFEIKTLRFE